MRASFASILAKVMNKSYKYVENVSLIKSSSKCKITLMKSLKNYIAQSWWSRSIIAIESNPIWRHMIQFPQNFQAYMIHNDW